MWVPKSLKQISKRVCPTARSLARFWHHPRAGGAGSTSSKHYAAPPRFQMPHRVEFVTDGDLGTDGDESQVELGDETFTASDANVKRTFSVQLLRLLPRNGMIP